MRHVVCVLMIIGFLSACTRAEKEQSTTLSFSLGDIGANATSGLADMNCVGVFVSAPEKEWQRHSCGYSSVDDAVNSVGFSYGAFYGPFYREKGVVGSPIEIAVPNGSDRVLRLVGVKVDASTSKYSNQTVCENLKLAPKLFSAYMESFYNIAESKPLELKGEDLAVDLTAAFDSSKEIPIASCTSLRSGEVSGVPSRIAVQVQDERANLLSKIVSINNCVGIKFQIQDAFGRPATAAAAVAATVDASAGNFYYPIASPTLDICAAVNLAPVVDNKVSLNFAAGTTDNVLYFRPHSMGSNGSINIQVEAVDGSLKGGSNSVNYITMARTPSKYAFYDLFSNTSSVKATVLSPATIRRNECRLGAVQFLDQYSAPYERSASSFTPDTIRVRALPAGSVEFFMTQSNCVASSGASSDQTITMPINSTATGFGFFYRVTAAAPSAISFEIQNMGYTPYPVIASGDLSSSSNVWQISN